MHLVDLVVVKFLVSGLLLAMLQVKAASDARNGDQGKLSATAFAPAVYGTSVLYMVTLSTCWLCGCARRCTGSTA